MNDHPAEDYPYPANDSPAAGEDPECPNGCDPRRGCYCDPKTRGQDLLPASDEASTLYRP